MQLERDIPTNDPFTIHEALDLARQFAHGSLGPQLVSFGNAGYSLCVQISETGEEHVQLFQYGKIVTPAASPISPVFSTGISGVEIVNPPIAPNRDNNN